MRIHAGDSNLAIATEPGFGDFDEAGRYRSYLLTRLTDVADVRRREEFHGEGHGRLLAALSADVHAGTRLEYPLL